MSDVSDISRNGNSKIRIAVIGNSNSVMRDSYVSILGRFDHIEVNNRSIGSSPNVVLLNFLAHETEFDYDYVIVETCVVDFIQSGGAFNEENSRENLELFISYCQAYTSCQIIILALPTRYAILDRFISWQEKLYQSIAEKYGLPILNVFNLVRMLIGRKASNSARSALASTVRIVTEFGLDHRLIHSLAWRELHDDALASNALGIYGFIDHAHLSPALHAVVGEILEKYITMDVTSLNKTINIERWTLPSRRLVLSIDASTPPTVRRESSLITRDLCQLPAGRSLKFHCPVEYLVSGIMLNKSRTSGIFRFSSPAGEAVIDLRFRPHVMDWNAIVVALISPIGGGDVDVANINAVSPDQVIHRVPDTVEEEPSGNGEFGELILVHREWRSFFSEAVADQKRESINIESAHWSALDISRAVNSMSMIVRGIKRDNILENSEIYTIGVASLLESSKNFAAVSMVRSAAYLSGFDKAFEKVKSLIDEYPNDPELQRMARLVSTMEREGQIQPNDMMSEAIALRDAGSHFEAERIVLGGMERFPNDIGFCIEYAWFAYHRRDWTEAVYRWNLVIDRFPDHHVGYLGRAMSLREAGLFNQAKNSFRGVSNRFPQNPEVQSFADKLNCEF